ncbi:hypothetical protein N0V82_008046 [Gnomoniopsis sp. IMI 355080]|nr:hypothetical protein N0V82_008046 [Gnomoniopsis sp. IMI 355080]
MAQDEQLSRPSDSNTYAYQPFPDDSHIRVLVLNPGEDDDPLSGFMEMSCLTVRRQASATPHVRWSADRPFEAISYVWGSNIMDHTILLDGKVHQITANLSDALHQCRLPDQPRALWADSICINQIDLKEKGAQVALMGRIYSCSQRTLICLGTDPEDRDHAQEALSVLWDTNEMMERIFQDSDFSWEIDGFPQPHLAEPLVDDQRWQSLSIMTKLDWFHRGWVVQEVALGVDALLLWAGVDIPWPFLSRAEHWYTWRLRQMIDKPDISNFMLHGLHHYIYRHQRHAEAQTLLTTDIKSCSILWALDYARIYSISDPRDRVYAFQALPFVKKPIPSLQPDYEQSYLRIYQDFAVKYLELTSNLNILLCVAHNEQTLDNTQASSWVPNWNIGPTDVNPRALEEVTGFGCISTDLRQFTIIDEKAGTSPYLQVRAVIFDSIRFTSSPIEDHWTIEDATTIWKQMKELNWLPSGDDGSNALHHSHAREFVKALTNGQWSGSSLADWAMLLDMYAGILNNDNVQESGIANNVDIAAKVQFFHQKTMKDLVCSKIFILGRGQFGLGPWIAKEGDICAFVFGVELPLILRNIPGVKTHHYKVIGPAYTVSKQKGDYDEPVGMNQFCAWNDWDELRESQGWEHLDLEVDEIVLE